MKNKRKRINNILEFPEEISSEEPKITIIGFEKIMVENYKGILEYESFYIRLKTTIGVVNINGNKLCLKEMTDENLLITGKIDNIDFEAIVEEEE